MSRRDGEIPNVHDGTAAGSRDDSLAGETTRKDKTDPLQADWCETCGQPLAVGHRCPVVAKVRYGHLTPFKEVDERGFADWVENMQKGGSGCAIPVRGDDCV